MTPVACLLNCLLALASWAAPQPQYSAGLIVNYGGDDVISANAAFHGYDLAGYYGGAASVSPAMLGRIMWARAEGGNWHGPFLIVDVGARVDAYRQIFEIGKVAEIPRTALAAMGETHGLQGYVFFGTCPPPADSIFYEPQPYAPPLVFDTGVPDGHKSFFPYPAQQTPVEC